MLNLFDSQATNRLRGYAFTPSAPEESGKHLPLYGPEAGNSSSRKVHRLLHVATQRKIFRIICLLLLIGVPYALFTSWSSTAATVATGAKPYEKSAASEIKSWLYGHKSAKTPEKPAPVISDANLDDSQCPGVLQGGAEAILCHVELAQRKFDAMLSRQSKTYEQAVARYVHQYKRQPPPGFEDWFKFAQQNNAAIIDDYGQLEKDLAPLRLIPGHVLRQRIKNALDSKEIVMYKWDFVNGTLSTSAPDGWEMVQSYRDIMAPFLDKLPNFSLLQNWDDNMKVCGPTAREEDINETKVNVVYNNGIPNARDYLTQSCPRYTGTDSAVTSDRPSVDMCSQFDDLENKHGLAHMYGACFNSSIPVLSTTRISTFQDITTASWCYGDRNYRLTDTNRDEIPYAQKKNAIYWRGSNTGSRSNLQFSFQTQRARLVMMAHQMKLKATELAARVPGAADGEVAQPSFTPADYTRVGLPNMPATFSEAQLSALSRLGKDAIDMNFVSLHYCDQLPKFCDEWKATIPLAARQPVKTAFENKFVMDLDGNSMSGRFYRMLESNSLVFKQTIYIEWHDDRIVPWLHYVPVHIGFEELPMLIDFFANHAKGQQLGQRIADASKQWAGTALRKIDLSVYTYRQMLELAHIIGHD
ncbi:hypothetical protein EX895_002792 [Sporisorium graminicola]|uniref:Glycosyl transferase CAP10 domain-containing protein n=1 Tax=Sporisorium graminicola TaxID=280036 RepID=A0A4U7KV98_9BASI|nr:hypothetical protein EX895_002792 [Sporisorium graminicola]TKY88440.1 hypothetical protein EX895_002792 [Sporisorium graminicola]